GKILGNILLLSVLNLFLTICVAELRLYSFRPAMAYMLDTMIDYYPNVEIYFLLNDGLENEITESVRTICKHYQIDCIELKGLDKMSGHPSVKGMKQISEQVKAYMAVHGK
uniref:SGNH/GDSL hydrolase family protein n=1 Tax=Phocaeicola vulgatus TaxID=821 RepID=UPI0032E4E1B7